MLRVYLQLESVRQQIRQHRTGRARGHHSFNAAGQAKAAPSCMQIMYAVAPKRKISGSPWRSSPLERKRSTKGQQGWPQECDFAQCLTCLQVLLQESPNNGSHSNMYSMCRSSAISCEAQVSKALSAYCNYQHANTCCFVQAIRCSNSAPSGSTLGWEKYDIVSQHFAQWQQCTCFALACDGCVSLSATLMFALCADGTCRTMYRIQRLYSG
jgi:hypothetical protein